MEKILVSACLLGQEVRYNGNSLSVGKEIPEQWYSEDRIVSICPEVATGMSIPRAPAEISNGDGNDVLAGNALVLDSNGRNVTDDFIRGAELALSLCGQQNIKVALLAESSPSCGSTTIYDGRFAGSKIEGVGVTTALLQKNGIQVFTRFSISAAIKAINSASIATRNASRQ